MAASKAFLYAQFLFLMSSCLSLKQDVALNFNTAEKEYQKKMSQGRNTFLELISKGVFVDKTLLIDAIVRYPEQNLAIARPPGWGKTINLDMLRMFFEIPTYPNGTRILPISSTPNYRLFKEGKYYSNGYNITLEKPLLISQPQYSHLIEEHLGQYPVIYCSFDDTPFTNNRDKYAIIYNIFEKLLDQHKYIEGDCAYRASHYAIRCRMGRLYNFFHKNPIILIDGYDRFSKKQRYMLIDPIDIFLMYCSVGYHEPDGVRTNKSILSGTEQGNFALLEHPDQFNHISPFQNLYGFTSTEMTLIYNHFSITKQVQNRIQYWYGGYKLNTSNVTKEDIFHPSAICSYLNTYKFEHYSLHKNYATYMNTLMRLETSLYIFTHSINGGEGLCFGKTVSSYDTPIRELESLFYRGYFKSDKWDSYTIPNFQIANHLQNTLAPYCTGLFNGSWSTLLTETCSIWDRFLLSDEPTSDKLQSNLKKCYKLMSRYYDNIIKNNFSHPISNSVKAQLSAVTSIMPSKKLHFVGWHYKFFPKNESDNLPETTILLSSGARGIFISIREDEDEINSVVNQSSRYTQILEQYAEFHGWKDIKFVDCKLLPDSKLEIHATVRLLNMTSVVTGAMVAPMATTRIAVL